VLIPSLVLAVLGVSSAAAAPARALDPGPWGGDEVALEVRAQGADVEFECATGHVDKRIAPDANGDFDLPGTLTPEGHGPAAHGEGSAAARYQGHVEGDTMTLSVLHGGERLGPYELTRDRRPILKKCR
jgi:hypothetical protein